MRKGVIILFLFVSIVSIVGCNKQLKDEEVKETTVIMEVEKLVIEKRIGTENQYEQVKEITDKEKIDKVLELLDKADWENAKFKKSLSPDFKINNNYFIWITPQRNMLEVGIQGQNKHTKLSEKNTKILYEIITDEKLGK